MHGIWKEFYNNGKLKFNGTYLNGKMHGLWEEFYDN